MALTCTEIPDVVETDEWVELHGHARNNRKDGDGRMEMNAPYLAGQYGVFVHIGNGKPAILDQASANRELKKLKASLPANDDTLLYAAPLLTDRTTPEMLLETRRRLPRNIPFWKAFLSGVSNDGGNSVTSFRTLSETIRAFYIPLGGIRPMIMHIHAERARKRNGRRLQMRDREWYAVRTDVNELLADHPDLEILLKHVSDKRTLKQVRKWRAEGRKVYVEICPHYLYRCHEDLYLGPDGGTAFNLHELCWPLYKDEESMHALREAVLSGEDWIVYGTDWACHVDDPTRSSGVKVNSEGIVVGGTVLLPALAKSLIIDLFVEAGKLEYLNRYVSGNARKIHNLPPSRRRVRHERRPERVPMHIEGRGPRGRKLLAKPFMRGQECNWHLQKAA